MLQKWEGNNTRKDLQVLQYPCARQIYITVSEIPERAYKEKNLIWLQVSEASAHGSLASLYYGREGLPPHGKGSYSSHGGQEVKRGRKVPESTDLQGNNSII